MLFASHKDIKLKIISPIKWWTNLNINLHREIRTLGFNSTILFGLVKDREKHPNVGWYNWQGRGQSAKPLGTHVKRRRERIKADKYKGFSKVKAYGRMKMGNNLLCLDINALGQSKILKKIMCFYVHRLLSYLKRYGVWGGGGNGVGQTVKLECLVIKATAHETSFK